MCNSSLQLSARTSLVTQPLRFLLCPLVSILAILPNWSRHSHFAWLTSVEAVKTLLDKQKCFPDFVWPISTCSGSTCFSYRRNSGKNIESTRSKGTDDGEREKWKPLNHWAFLVEIYFFRFCFDFEPCRFAWCVVTRQFLTACCDKARKHHWTVWHVFVCVMCDKNQVPHTNIIKHEREPGLREENCMLCQLLY